MSCYEESYCVVIMLWMVIINIISDIAYENPVLLVTYTYTCIVTCVSDHSGSYSL